MTIAFDPPYGPPGPGTGWENGRDASTPLSAAAMDTELQGLIDVIAAANEILTGPLGHLVLAYAKLPVGITAGTVAAGDDSRFAGADPALVNALVIAYESSPGSGVYTRPDYDGPVGFLGIVPALTGGTTAGGTGTNVAVSGKDVSLEVFA